MAESVYMLCCNADEVVPIPGVVDKCSKCGAGVSVTYASLEIAARKNAKYICFECYMKMEKKDFRYEPIAPGQVDEFLDSLKKGF